MKKSLLVLLILALASTAGAWTLPVPSGLAVGDIPYAVDSSTLGVSSTQLTDQVAFIGPRTFLPLTGTWTLTRYAAGNVAYVKTAADDTFTINVDITEVMRSTALKGFKLSSVKYVYGLGGADLTSHSITFYSTTFSNAAAPVAATLQAATSITPLTAGTVTSPNIFEAAVTVPAYLNPLAVAATPVKYSIEINGNASAAGTTYNIYGIFLFFTSNNVF